MEKLVNFTKEALAFIKNSIAEEKCLGIRINIVSGGCKGMAYELSFVKEVNSADLLVEEDGIKVYIASKAVIFISGMTINYVKSPMGGNIVFENPNAKLKCSCGKSFCVDEYNEECKGGCCSH